MSLYSWLEIRTLKMEKETEPGLWLESAPFGAGRFKVSDDGTVAANYYITDHLGSTRVVFDANKNVLDRINYYPFGGTWSGTETRYNFSGKESQEKFGYNVLDFGARKYNPTLVRWTGPDPLSEKYRDISPYVYCANNPISYVDPDGKKVWPAPGSSKEFLNKIKITVEFMNEKGTAGMLKELHDSEQIVYIRESKTPRNYFDIKDQSMNWNPDIGFLMGEATISPATVLNHEVDHALGWVTDSEKLNERLGAPDSEYGNAEERRVITGSEQETALKHGEIQPGEVTRKSHKAGTPVHAASPISVFSVEPIIITAAQYKMIKKLRKKPEIIRDEKCFITISCYVICK